ncbi:MAG: PAS domain S-box protein [Promethearchaeota archaeon]
MIDLESSVFSLSECEELKNLLKNPEDDFQTIISLLEKKVEKRTLIIKGSEEKYHSLITVLTNIGFGIDIISKDFKILYQNEVLRDTFGDCEGKICYEKYMGEESKCSFCQMEETLETKEVNRNELKAVDNRIYEIISAPYPNFDGTFDKVLEIIIDITEKKIVEQKLIESEEKYRMLTEQSLFGIFIIQDGIFKYINQGVSDIIGYSVDEMLQWTGFDLVKTIFSEDLESIMNRLKRSEIGDLDEQSSSVFRLVTKSGDIKWVEEYNKRIKFQGKFASMVTLIDISSRIQSEHKLKESEYKYRHLFYNLPIGISIFDSKGNLIESNNVILKRLSEYANIEFTGKNFLEIIPYFQNTGQLFKLFTERFEIVSKGENPGAVELYFNTKQGQRIWLYWNSSIIEINKDVFIQVIMQDITEQKKVEEKLRESEEKFRNISEQSLIGIGIIQDNLVKYVNKKFADIFGYKVEEMLSWSPEEFMITVHPEDKEFVLDQVKKKQSGFEDYLENYQFRGVRKSGEIIWIENFTKTMMFEGKLADFVAFIEITERKNAQQELIKLNQLKSELLRRTSHELKTPLVSIKGFTDLLLNVHRDKLDAMVISTLNEIKQGCLRLETLISDILKTAELESGAIRLNKNEEDLSFLVNVCVNEIKGFSTLRNHTINLNVQKNLITQFEKEQIHQVISNVLTNAVKYTPPGGVIEIKSEIIDDFIVLSIKDNGIGFTEEEKSRIFKQFGKIERYGQGLDIIAEGSGFGLFISKKIIELHGGEMWLESKGRKMGSTFYFSLPIIQN